MVELDLFGLKFGSDRKSEMRREEITAKIYKISNEELARELKLVGKIDDIIWNKDKGIVIKTKEGKENG